MDKELFAFVDKQIPRFNERVCGGFAVGEMKHVEEFVHRIWKCAEESFPPGLQYMGYERCTPQEEYNTITAKRHNRQSYEVSQSNMFLVKYMFRFQGEDFKPRFIYLPYVTECGLITILGSDFQISPVLADKAISVGVDNIFIPLYRDKLTFRRLVHPFIVDDTRVNSYVIWSSVYHTSSRRGTRNAPSIKKTVDAEATVVHYLFCKYGLTRTFADFAGADVVVADEGQINHKTHPPSIWRICRSTRVKPSKVRSKFYKPSNVVLAIRHEHYNQVTESMIASFFYVADHYPEEVQPEYVDDLTHWLVLMGYVYIVDKESKGKLANAIQAHIESLDDYVDVMSQDELRNEGIHVNDVYELFFYVVEHFSTMITNGSTEVASMYDKRLKVNRYVLFDVIKGIFNMTFELKKHTKKQISKKEIIDTMNKHIKQELAFDINKSHPEATSISSPGDNMIFKITSNIVLQTSAGAGGKSKKTAVVEPSKLLHVSIAPVGSYSNLPKSDPTGRNRINPNVELTADGSIVKRTDIAELLDRTQANIQR